MSAPEKHRRKKEGSESLPTKVVRGYVKGMQEWQKWLGVVFRFCAQEPDAGASLENMVRNPVRKQFGLADQCIKAPAT